MFSKNKAKFIKSLQIKKFRIEYKQFLVEGAKSVVELLNSDYTTRELFVTEKFHQEHTKLFKKLSLNPEVVTEKILTDISSFSTNNAALAIADCKPNLPIEAGQNEYAIILDEIKDPGNLGTIIRIADWYGIKKIICSENTADQYNPKVIASSMGSFTRTQLYYCDLDSYLSAVKLPIYAADLNGKNVHQFSFAPAGYLIMGNESEGPSQKTLSYATDKIHIPKFGQAESLNVAIATAVICDNLRRK